MVQTRRLPAAQNPAKPRRDLFFLGFLAILILAAGLRLYAVETANLWLDEFWTLELSTGRGTAHEHVPVNVFLPALPNFTSLAGAPPWTRVWTSLNEVTHPPLFFLLLRGWRTLLGSSDIAARLLPWLASLAGIALLYHAVRLLNGPWPALWAGLLMALSGQQIFYAQEIRSYSLIVALGLAAGVVLLEIERRGASIARNITLSACILALLMTHYFTIGLVAALGIYAIVRLPGAARLRVLAAFAAAGLIFALAWGPFMLRQAHAMGLHGHGSASFLLDARPGHFGRTMARLIAVPAQAIALSTPSLIAWLALPAFLAPLWWIRRRDNLFFWYLWTAGVLLPLVALDLARFSMHLGFPRYTLLAGPGIFAVIAAGFSSLRGAWKHVAPALVAAACLVLLPRALRAPGDNQDWGLVADIAAQYMAPGDPLIVTAPPDNAPATDLYVAPMVYLYVSHFLSPMNRPGMIVTAPLSAAAQSKLHAYRHVWVISGWRKTPPLFPGADVHPIAGPMFGELKWRR